jgi:cyanophycin synthetase
VMDSVRALGDRRTTMIVGLPGDRRDEDIQATVRTTVPGIDHYILHDLKLDQRGRGTYEVPNLMKAALPADASVEFIPTQEEAILKAWHMVKPGERLVILADIVDEAVETVRKLAQAAGEDAECDMPLARAAVMER